MCHEVGTEPVIADCRAVTIGAVNPDREPHELRVRSEGMSVGTAGTGWIITGAEPSSNKEAGSEQVTIAEQPASFDGSLQVTPLSVTLVRLPAH